MPQGMNLPCGSRGNERAGTADWREVLDYQREKDSRVNEQ